MRRKLLAGVLVSLALVCFASPAQACQRCNNIFICVVDECNYYEYCYSTWRGGWFECSDLFGLCSVSGDCSLV